MLIKMLFFNRNRLVAYDFLTLTNTLNEKNFMMKGLIEAFCRYLGEFSFS